MATITSATTRISFLKLQYLSHSNKIGDINALLSNQFVVSVRFLGCLCSGTFEGDEFVVSHLSSDFDNQTGLFHQSLKDFKFPIVVPRDEQSAGLALEFTYRHCNLGKTCRISDTLFATKVVQVLGIRANHCSTIMELVQKLFQHRCMVLSEKYLGSSVKVWFPSELHKVPAVEEKLS